ncbi:MAG: hypothetical protein KF690_05810 [Bacteroidetes bacterium]|nr:hypothetical protein [Bacteroidota bacterium]
MIHLLLPLLHPLYSEEQIRERIHDHGPIYAETNPDHLIMEPWNMVSAALFIGIVFSWIVRLRGQFRQHPFLAACLPLLLVGGVGGTIYHGFRAHDVWLVMDWLPILLLSLLTSIFFWRQLRLSGRTIFGIIGGLFVLQVLISWAIRMDWLPLSRMAGISISYGMMALLMLLPISLVLYRTGYRHARFIVLALSCFLLAVSARALDLELSIVFPMGTHFLWHTFGALAATLVMEYVYRYQRTINAVRKRHLLHM